MNTLTQRGKLIDIAMRDVGLKETSRNHGPAIEKFWPATSYPDGYQNREPYCAAAVCYWVREWLSLPDVQAALGFTTVAQAMAWRCRSARAFDWIQWAKEKKLRILSDSPEETLHTGDIVVYDFSHIGIVINDSKTRILTIEANTGPAPGNEGDGIYRKDRPKEVARAFIRLLE